MASNAKTTKPGMSQLSHEPEKAQIAVEGADELSREIRIENTLEDEAGKRVKLKQGAHVLVTVEADTNDTVSCFADPNQSARYINSKR
jgi:hypothetical protein